MSLPIYKHEGKTYFFDARLQQLSTVYNFNTLSLDGFCLSSKKDNKKGGKIMIKKYVILFLLFSCIIYFLMLYSYNSSTLHSIPNQVVVTTNYLNAIKIYTNHTYLPINDNWHIDSINFYFASQKEYSLLLVKYSNGTHTTYRIYFNDNSELKLFG